MHFNKGNDREQVTFFTHESQIEENNPERFVDAFCGASGFNTTWIFD